MLKFVSLLVFCNGVKFVDQSDRIRFSTQSYLNCITEHGKSVWKEPTDLRLNPLRHNAFEHSKNPNTGHTDTSCGSCVLVASPRPCLCLTHSSE